MKKRIASTKLSAAFAILVALVVVLPASAACSDVDCCPEAADAGACQGCLVEGCEEQDPGFVVNASAWAIELPRAPETPVAAAPEMPRFAPTPARTPGLPPGLSTTVLLI